MQVEFGNISNEIVVIAQIMIELICITKLLHDFINEPWSKSSLLQSQTQTATSCKQINKLISCFFCHYFPASFSILALTIAK